MPKFPPGSRCLSDFTGALLLVSQKPFLGPMLVVPFVVTATFFGTVEPLGRTAPAVWTAVPPVGAAEPVRGLVEGPLTPRLPRA